MMQAFRNSAKVAGAIFALLMFVFVLTSVDWSGLGTTTTVGKVNGQSIDARTYQTAVQQTIDNRQRQSPASLTLEDRTQIEDQVWDQFVDGRVLDAEYRRRGITVSEDEMVEAIRNSPPADFQSVPEFQTDSQFDLGKYQRWLTSSVAAEYLPMLEAQYRDQIRRSKLLRVVTADVYLSDPALWEQYRDEHEMVKIGLTAIIPRNAVPDSSVKLSDAEIEEYYRAHMDDFKRPATAFLSFVALPRLTNASDSALAHARADSARAEIAAGTPFADVARRESADTASAEKGGDLGEWTKGSMDPAFDSAAFALPLKTVSKPVLSQFGYHLIEITSRSGKKAKGRHILFPIEVAGAHRDLLDARADSLERLAADRTERRRLWMRPRRRWRSRSARPCRCKREPRCRWAISSCRTPECGPSRPRRAPPARSSRPVSPSTCSAWTASKRKGSRRLAQIRPAATFAARNDKKRLLAKEIAQNYMKRLDSGASMADAAKAMNLPHREFGPFSRINPPLTDPTVIGTAFGLDAGQRSGLLDTKDGLYVLETLEHMKADSAQFVKELDQFRLRTIQLARQDRVRGYLQALRASAKIVDNRAKLQQQMQQQQQQAPVPQPPV